jgi:hypothetical protein
MIQSHENHISRGRTPWLRRIQLRQEVAPRPDEPEPVYTLSQATRNAEPLAYFTDWQKVEAKHRLRVLCDWLDDRLKNPAHIHKIGKHARRVTVFDSLAYSIYSDSRFMISGEILDGRYEANDFSFEIGHPLTSSYWLRSVLKNLKLADSAQSDLMFNAALGDDLAQWLADVAYRALLKNPSFQELRRNTLPRLFKIPRDMFSIALASRIRPKGSLMESRTLNNVWRNEPAFRQVARENPHLLPLLLAYVEQIPPGKTVRTKDPILTLKSALRDAGISEAAWRYLVRHGSRLFKIPWTVAAGQQHLEVVIRYLIALDSVGLPPPPPPSIAKAFLHGYNPHQRNAAQIGQHFHVGIDPVALRAGLLEADRRRKDQSVDGFAEEFLGVCWWSEGLDELLDANQLKAGWPWFVRRWLEAEEAQAMLDDTEKLHWMPRLNAFEMGRMNVVPLDSSESLIRESLAMRNCLQSYIENCAEGNFEVYSVREKQTGKRKGCIGIRFDDGIPMIVDVKGFANTPPIGEVQQIACELFVRLQGVAGWNEPV